MLVKDRVYLLGIRHHGPGSAFSVTKALQEIQPDCVLIEGPAELESAVPWLCHESTKFPVSVLTYNSKQVAQSCFYPFVEFSPELQALRYCGENNTQLKMFDLPVAMQMGRENQLIEQAEQAPDKEPDAEQSTAQTQEPEPLELINTLDPIDLLAKAAGYDDGERWWETLVESRQNGLPVFTAVGEAMAAAREAIEEQSGAHSEYNAIREAWMRKILRASLKEHNGKIAVVCGAWHVPALAAEVKVKDDNATLKGIAKVPVHTTLIPWTSQRMSLASGYGAGLRHPGWYQHIWQCYQAHEVSDKEQALHRLLTQSWLGKVAKTLRAQKIDVSTASVIESARLVETLAAMREIAMPSIPEFNEAISTVMCFGDATPLKLIERDLLVGNLMGKVPEGAPKLALKEEFDKQVKSLRLKLSSEDKQLELDLRKPLDLQRSVFFHRLLLLNIKWAAKSYSSSRGTFKEAWKLQWLPELELDFVSASIFGSTVENAASASTVQQLEGEAQLNKIAALLKQLLFAELPGVIDVAIEKLHDRASVEADLDDLMASLPELVEISRYGNVRKSDVEPVLAVIHSVIPRISARLPSVCHSLDEDPARALAVATEQCDHAIALLAVEQTSEFWITALRKILQQGSSHGFIAGKCCRLLMEHQQLGAEETADMMQYELSQGSSVERESQWLEGFIAGGATILIHDDVLWNIVDEWLRSQSSDRFIEQLPILRKCFAQFSREESAQLLNKAKHGKKLTAVHKLQQGFDYQTAEKALANAVKLLALNVESAHE